MTVTTILARLAEVQKELQDLDDDMSVLDQDELRASFGYVPEPSASLRVIDALILDLEIAQQRESEL